MSITLEADLAQIIEGKADEESVEVPVAVLREILRRRDKTLTTQAAADLLGVSRPFVVKLIDKGQMAAEMVGTHRRVRLSEVERYRARRREKAEAAMDELVALTEELGLYEHQNR